MRAGDLAAPFPVVELSAPAIEAARLLADQNLPGLVVVDDRGRPVTILAGTQVLRMIVPAYFQDDPTLARVVDEAHADLFPTELEARTVAECLPDSRSGEHRELPVVDAAATALEVAALMARSRCPLVAVVTEDQSLAGVITLDALLDRMLAS